MPKKRKQENQRQLSLALEGERSVPPMGIDYFGKPVRGSQALILKKKADLMAQISMADDRAKKYLELEHQIKAFFPKMEERAKLLRAVAFSLGHTFPIGKEVTEEELLKLVYNRRMKAKERSVENKAEQLKF